MTPETTPPGLDHQPKEHNMSITQHTENLDTDLDWSSVQLDHYTVDGGTERLSEIVSEARFAADYMIERRDDFLADVPDAEPPAFTAEDAYDAENAEDRDAEVELFHLALRDALAGEMIYGGEGFYDTIRQALTNLDID